MIDPQLLEILACPEDKSTLHQAEEELIAKINRDIGAGQVKNRAGQPVTEPIEGGLVRQDGKWLYPVRDDIPVMLIEEAIPLTSSADPS